MKRIGLLLCLCLLLCLLPACKAMLFAPPKATPAPTAVAYPEDSLPRFATDAPRNGDEAQALASMLPVLDYCCLAIAEQHSLSFVGAPDDKIVWSTLYYLGTDYFYQRAPFQQTDGTCTIAADALQALCAQLYEGSTLSADSADTRIQQQGTRYVFAQSDGIDKNFGFEAKEYALTEDGAYVLFGSVYYGDFQGDALWGDAVFTLRANPADATLPYRLCSARFSNLMEPPATQD